MCDCAMLVHAPSGLYRMSHFIAGLCHSLTHTFQSECCGECQFSGGLGRRGRPAAVEMVRPPTAAAAALARVQQAVGGALQGVGGALHGLGLGNALQNLRAGGALQGLGAGRGAGGSSASPSLRGSSSGLKAIPEDIP